MRNNYRNVISIPVHEKPEVVIDLLCNIKHYTSENTAVVLHISKGFNWNSFYLDEDQFLNILVKMDNVFVNTERLDTKWGGIIQTHISNFKFIDKKIDFDYFIIMASNELLISDGIDDWIGDRHIGIRDWQLLDTNNWCFEQKARNDLCLKRMIEKLDTNLVVVCRPEGSFYQRDIFRKMVQIIDEYYVFDIDEENYPREEIYFPTIALSLIDRSKVKRGIYNGLIKDYIQENSLNNIINDGQISVKPIPRELYNEGRIFIRQSYNKGYFDVVKNYLEIITWIKQR